MKRLFFYFTGIFVLLMGVLLIFQYQREHNFRKGQLNEQLIIYNNLIYNYIHESGHSNTDVRDFMRVLPDSTLRITAINLEGDVLFDSQSDDSIVFENHLTRPEIQEAKEKGMGQSLHFSKSVGTDYYYLAQRFPDMYVRTSLPYTINLQHSLGINTMFIYLMAVLFILAIIAIYLITKKMMRNVQEQKLQIRRQLTQNISHELKTPVAGISGYLESILTNPNITEEKKHLFIERSFEQTKRLASLLEDISVLNKLTENTELYKKTNCNLTDIIQTVLKDTLLQTEQQHCLIRTDLPTEMPIFGNKNLLYSIFRNLTDNALIYAGEGVTITIKSLCEDHKFYYFSFADNGVGVPDEHIDRIFERFYRIDNGRSRKTGGTGLGLSIVKNALLFHGGTISARNCPEGGLEFTFSIRK